MINGTTIKEFREPLRGSLIEPSDKAYEDARKVHNGMIKNHPLMIVRCENYERLVTIKNKYDHDNIFRYNQNIKPQ